MAAQVVDELFLTLSPEIAGRSSDAMRPALVEGMAFMPRHAPWFQLLSVKQSSDRLYLRYRHTTSELQRNAVSHGDATKSAGESGKGM